MGNVMKKPVIFLDIDEVLCGVFSALTNNSKIPNFWREDLNKNYFNLESLRLVKTLLDLTGADIVLSSTWRLCLKTPEDKARLEQVLGFPILDVTGQSKDGCRGQEIKEYVDNNCIASYIIVDDSDRVLGYQQQRLVKVKPWKGFDMDNFLDSCVLLNVKDNRVEALLKTRKYYWQQFKKELIAHRDRFFKRR